MNEELCNSLQGEAASLVRALSKKRPSLSVESLSDSEYSLVRELDTAVHYLREEVPEAASWSGILENNLGGLYRLAKNSIYNKCDPGSVESLENYMRREMIRDIWVIFGKMDHHLVSLFSGSIETSIQLIVYSRMLGDRAKPGVELLAKRLYPAIQHGCIPCGWTEKDFPLGKLVIYKLPVVDP